MLLFIFLFIVLGIQDVALSISGWYSTTERYTQALGRLDLAFVVVVFFALIIRTSKTFGVYKIFNHIYSKPKNI